MGRASEGGGVLLRGQVNIPVTVIILSPVLFEEIEKTHIGVVAESVFLSNIWFVRTLFKENFLILRSSCLLDVYLLVFGWWGVLVGLCY